MKKLSIITVNYNNLEGLKTTFKSVKNQTWQDFEYLVIDGDSTDGSIAFLEDNVAHINYWVSEPDTGVYHAMNKGVLKATGEYLLFLNSGDHFFNNKVLAKNIYSVENYDIIYFNQKVVGKTKTFIKEYPDTLSFAYFLKDNLPHQASFIKSELLKSEGLFEEDFKIVSDWKFFLDSICKHNASYCHIDKTLTVFYQDGISSKLENLKVIEAEKQIVLKKSYSLFMNDLDDVLKYMTIVHNLRRSKKIKLLIKLRLLNKF
ncbi:glycosyltransferase family 2 protein [Mariniflexile jejuense]|uniref:Glycosyltransferase family 2 protein n=1 Tax=Mariniflexile jejuense TaxID=1173582 RepID=A0ABW3JHY7_9FLAO